MVNASTVKSIQDIMRKDVGVDGDAQRLGQLVWMLFLKIYDDREYEWEALDPTYESPIPDGLRWRDWAADDEGLTGDDLLSFVNNQLFPALKGMPAGTMDERGAVVGAVFLDAYNYMKSGTLLRQVLSRIDDGLDFNRSEDRHAFGDIYEQLLRSLQNAGTAGEYYTPRPVTRLMVQMIAPKPGEVIFDPACGTGGFLTCSLEHLREHYVTTADEEQRAQRAIHGVEKKPLPHLLCTTNMMLHGIDTPSNIRRDNTLSRPLRDYGPGDRVDVIITNPPFGGTEEDGIEKNFPSAFQTRETADLFLVLIMHLLKSTGRAAVILPDGGLSGGGVRERVRRKLLEECNLHTVVRLPEGVFSPYTDIPTNLLFFDRNGPTTGSWYYEVTPPAGRKRFTKTNRLLSEHLRPLTEWWDNRVESDSAWYVPASEIIRADDAGSPLAVNLDIRNPARLRVEAVRSPEEIITALRGRQAAISSLIDQFENLAGEDL